MEAAIWRNGVIAPFPNIRFVYNAVAGWEPSDYD
jgi:hypothetical protein